MKECGNRPFTRIGRFLTQIGRMPGTIGDASSTLVDVMYKFI